ncbi:LysR family transcriptional regulator [Vibrio quintilis]|nr:LysR family transcriptional regulator [Vibrio quintilis]
MMNSDTMALYLDIHAVEAFVKVAELNSFTLAAESLCVTQSGVTVKVQRLEKHLGCSLFHRTPRHVYLSPEGKEFLFKARVLLEAHRQAINPYFECNELKELTICIGEHVINENILDILNNLKNEFKSLRVNINVNMSEKILYCLENKKIDIAIVSQDGDKRGGETVRKDTYSWYASELLFETGPALPLITLHDSCRLCQLVIELLTEHHVKWYHSFQGGGLHAMITAAKSGLGVVPLPDNALSPEDRQVLKNVGDTLNLPCIPDANIVIYNNCLDQQSRLFLKKLTQLIQNNVFSGINSQVLENTLNVC